MRCLLALVLFAPVPLAFAQDDDTPPVAPPPRLKAAATGKKKADPSTAAATGKRKVETTAALPPKDTPEPKPVAKVMPTPEPAPKPAPTPEPKTVVKVDPTPATAAKADTGAEPKPKEPTAEVKLTPPAPNAHAAFLDHTVPLYTVFAFAGLAALVVIRTYALPAR